MTGPLTRSTNAVISRIATKREPPFSRPKLSHFGKIGHDPTGGGCADTFRDWLPDGAGIKEPVYQNDDGSLLHHQSFSPIRRVVDPEATSPSCLWATTRLRARQADASAHLHALE
jgi:hypothetical protein